jgi:hypothetical protein
MDDISSAGFALGADHGRAFRNAAESFTKVTRATNERSLEGVFIDVMFFVRGSENFTFVNEVDAELLQNLGFSEVADASLGHHRNRNRGDDLLDEARLGHAGYAAFGANHRGNALQRHHGDGPGLFGNFRLLDVHHIHDDSALQHLGQTDLEAKACGAIGVAAVRSGMIRHARMIRHDGPPAAKRAPVLVQQPPAALCANISETPV